MNSVWILALGFAMFVFLMLYLRFPMFLLQKRISTLEHKLGVKTKKYGDKCEYMCGYCVLDKIKEILMKT